MRSCLVAALAASACATVAPPAIDPDARAAPPFSAAQIRDATRPGRVYRFSVEAEGEMAYFRQMEFIAVSEDGCRLRSSMFDFDSNIMGEPVVSEMSWDEFEGHATWALAATRISSTTTETPAGAFDAWLYTVNEGEVITRAWFARGLPGPPVRYEQERDGAVVYTQTLVEYREP